MEGRRIILSRSYDVDLDIVAYTNDGSITIKTTRLTTLTGARAVETQMVHIKEEDLVAMLRNLGYIVEAVENKEG